MDQKLRKNLKGKQRQNKIKTKQNKPKLLPNSHPGVYQLGCSCNGKYIGDSKVKVLASCIEHQ